MTELNGKALSETDQRLLGLLTGFQDCYARATESESLVRIFRELSPAAQAEIKPHFDSLLNGFALPNGIKFTAEDQPLVTNLTTQFAARNAAKEEAARVLDEIAPLLQPHELRLIGISPEGLSLFRSTVETGKRADLAKAFTESSRSSLKDIITAGNAEREIATILEKAETTGVKAAEKSGNKGLWIGGIIAAVVAIGAFISLNKKSDKKYPKQSEILRQAIPAQTQGIA